jgi:hypothetical protein
MGGIGGGGGGGGSGSNDFITIGGLGGNGGFGATWLIVTMPMITRNESKIAFFISVVLEKIQKQLISTIITNFF